jgi:signal transduction histidine kinase/CheY-like chemotaxis protein
MNSSEKGHSGTIRMLRLLKIGALLLPALLFTLAAWRDRSDILMREENDGVKLVALLNEQAEHLLSGHEILLDIVVEHMRDRDWDEVPTDLLHELEVIDRRLDGESDILLADASGQTRATTLHLQPNQRLPVPDQDCFLSLSRNETKTCISQPHPDPVSGDHLFSLSRRLDNDGKFNGVAQVAISVAYIADLWTSVTSNVSDIITMYRSDGTILAQSGPRPNAANAQEATGSIGGPSSATGDRRLTIQRKLADYPVQISLHLDKAAILAPWYSNITVYGVVAGITTIGMLLALQIATARAQKERRAVALWQAEAQERESTQAQLLQSQKMESLGQLTGGIAHDFNNLLTVIIGNVGIVQNNVPDGDDRRMLRSVLRAGESAVTLTQRLLAFARKQILQPRSVDLLGLVEGMRSLLTRTLGPDVRLSVFADPQLWPSQVDPNQIELIILNLAINARDAMPTGGTLSITLSNGEPGPGAPHELAPGQYVVLTVSDTGTGMNETTLARATEPFFTTKGPGKGTGLGLSMMQGVVTQSGGAARIDSKPGRGTQIELWLPRADAAPAEDAVRDLHREPQGDGAILVCDDNSAVLEYVCDALKIKGYRVLPAGSGRAAISMLGENASIRLLIVDFLMPEMNGAAVAREVRTRHPRLPILLITGNADPEATHADLPDVPVLCKPFDQEQLAARVKDLLAA